MNKSIAIIASISISLTLAAHASEPARWPHLLDELEKGRNKKIEQAYQSTLDVLAKNPLMQRELLSKALDILLFRPQECRPRFPLLHDRISSIDKAITRFDLIPGFRSLLVKVIQQSCAQIPQKIYWQELTTALLLQAMFVDLESQEKIVAFGLPADYAPTSPIARLYNIITNQRWIECKTIRWNLAAYNKCSAKRKNLRRQLLRQQALVNEYNEQKQQALSYELFSQYPVNASWQKWLADRKIPYSFIFEEKGCDIAQPRAILPAVAAHHILDDPRQRSLVSYEPIFPLFD